MQALPVVPGCDSGPLLQFIEGSFNQVPVPVVFPRVPVVRPVWDDHLGAGSLIKVSNRLLSYPLSAMTAPVSIPL